MTEFKLATGRRQISRSLKILSGFALFVSLGCAQRSVNPPEVSAEAEVGVETPAPEVLKPELSDQAIQGLRLLIDNVDEALASEEEPANEVIAYRNERVRFWLNYFTVRDRERFQRYLRRGQRYHEVVRTTLEENDLPNELYFLAMIESGYATHAYSRASAVGVWQFIAATGRRYGLHYDYYVDERRDPIQATEGASRYLRDLYNAFLSWELSMAAYNAGELRVLRAIMDGQTRDYWTMSMQKRLPRETREYVPKFIAASLIGRNPEKYGFEDPVKDFDPFPSVVAFEVPSPIRLKDFSKVTGISHEKLKALNPHLRRGTTPGNRRKYEIWVPEANIEQAKLVTEKLASLVRKSEPAYHDSDHHYHVVRRGDNLSTIAQRYRVSVSTLKRINGLSSNRIHPGKKLRISRASYRRPSGGGSRYVIRRGDNLGLIAKRYNTSVRELKRTNGLRGNRIVAGQSLVIPSKAGSSGQYQVRRGDTLETIARRNGLTIRQLKTLNGMRRNTIYVGEWLKISQGI